MLLFQINLIASADVPIQNLFQKDNIHHVHDEARLLMDDLNIHHAEVQILFGLNLPIDNCSFNSDLYQNRSKQND